LVEEAIATFRCQAVEALAHEGYHERMVGYSMLLKIRLEDLIEQAFLRAGAPNVPPLGAARQQWLASVLAAPGAAEA